MNLKKSFVQWLRKLLLEADEAEKKAASSPARPAVAPTSNATLAQNAAAPAAPAGSGEMELPLAPILEKLPAELRARLTTPLAELGEASMSIPASQILPQLASGAVRISFGQLRSAAPGLFNVGEEHDSVQVSLPLDLVLARLSRQWMSRDTGQKKMEAPKDIGSVFIRRIDVATPAPASAPIPVKATEPPAPAPRIATPDTQIKLRLASGAIKPTVAAPTVSAIRPVVPAPAASPKPIAQAVPLPAAAPIAPRRETPVTSVISPPQSRPVAAATPPPGTLAVPLAMLAEKWPESLRSEIAQFGLTPAQVFLPLYAVESAMKRGIVVFFWRDLRGYIHPPLTGISIHDGSALELPLKVVAPLFMTQKAQGRRSQTSAEIDKSIPDVFVNSSAAKVEMAAVAPLVDVVPPPAPVPSAPKPSETKLADMASVPHRDSTEPKRLEVPEMDTGSTRALAPTEIVRRAMAMSGVAGALVVLHDGLMVACELPPYVVSDTVAAFLPQMYDRLSQCAGGLQMGALTHLRFDVGNVSWQVFRLSSVFFAVFGRDEELPQATQLASLAAELDRIRQ